MANPQITDAHLRIAHSINEAIMMRDFTKRQRKILDLILRLSWGCNKKEAIIPFQKDFCLVGINEVDIRKELEWLVVSKVIIRDDTVYSFNKNFDDWEVSRVKPFLPDRLSELLSLNLNGKRELSKTLSQKDGDLVKHESETSQNTNSSKANLATSKEILNKDYIYIYNNRYKKGKKETFKKCDYCGFKSRTALQYCPECESKGDYKLLSTDYTAGYAGDLVRQ